MPPSEAHRSRAGAEGAQKIAASKFATRRLATPTYRLRFLHREPPGFRFTPGLAGSAKASVSMSMNAAELAGVAGVLSDR
jgi:hypothetical protein